MTYYAIIYFIRKFLISHIRIVFIASLAIIIAASFIILDMEHSVIYAQVSFMKWYYFMFMLMGAVAALDIQETEDKKTFRILTKICIGGG